VVDEGRAQQYALVGSSELVFDLERVTSEESAVQFVGKYGLPEMETRPFITAAWVMPVDRFLWLAETVRMCLQIYRWMRPAVEGDPDALAELRKLEPQAREVTGRGGMGVTLEPEGERLITDLRRRARRPGLRTTDAELLALMAQALAFLINIGLVGVEERVSPSMAWPMPREGAEWPQDAFTVNVQAKTLAGAVFHYLALVILNRRPLAACERCGSLYFREDPRQRFCTAVCADRARRERHRLKQQTTAPRTSAGARKGGRRGTTRTR